MRSVPARHESGLSLRCLKDRLPAHSCPWLGRPLDSLPVNSLIYWQRSIDQGKFRFYGTIDVLLQGSGAVGDWMSSRWGD